MTTFLQNFISARLGKAPSAKNYWDILGVVALFSYSFFWLIDIRISRFAEILLLISFCISFSYTKDSKMRRDPLIVLFVVWVLIQVGARFFLKDLFQDLGSSQIKGARHYSKVFLIFIVAWWLRGSVNSVVAILLATVLGFMLGSTFGGEGIINDFNRMIAHGRIDLGYLNAQHTSVYSAFTLLTLLFFWGRILDYFSMAWRWVGVFLLAFGVFFSLFGLISTQTRASWLGLALSAILLSPICILVRISRHTRKWRSLVHLKLQPSQVLGLLLILLFMGGLTTNTDRLTFLKYRLGSEGDVVKALLEGTIEDVRMSPISIRVISWKNALRFITERPLMGWGPSANKELLKKTTLARLWKGLGHFHNSYIELALAYGVFGIIIFTLIVGIVGLRTWQAWKRGDLPDDLMLFASSFFIYWVVVNCFESYIMFNTGFYLNAIVGGSLYTFHIKHSPETIHKTPENTLR